MDSTELKELIKKEDGSVATLAEKLGVNNRQTMYNYIQRYADGDLTKIPENVCRHFQELTVTDSPAQGSDLISMITSRGDDLQKSKTVGYALALANEDLIRLNEELGEMSQIGDMELQFADTEDEEAYLKKKQKMLDDRSKLEGHIKALEEEKERLEKNRTYRDYLDMVEESVDSKLRHQIEQGGYGGPSWHGKDSQTVCIAESGDYMVILWNSPIGYSKAKLFLYAVIGGKRTHIATYDFNDNESFVRFSLIPKLSYYYEVVEYGPDGDHRTGIQPLVSDA